MTTADGTYTKGEVLAVEEDGPWKRCGPAPEISLSNQWDVPIEMKWQLIGTGQLMEGEKGFPVILHDKGISFLQHSLGIQVQYFMLFTSKQLVTVSTEIKYTLAAKPSTQNLEEK